MGAALLADALATARRAGATRLVIVHADSAYYCHDIIAAARRAGARFSVTARHTPAVTSAITAIPGHAWIPIHYLNAIWIDDQQRWISDAKVAETTFTGRPPRRAHHRAADRVPGPPPQPHHRTHRAKRVAHRLADLRRDRPPPHPRRRDLHARARTIRAQLINTPGRIARSANRLVLHLPWYWPWESSLDGLFRHALHGPLATAA